MEVPCQDGALTAMLPPEDLIAGSPGRADTTLMFLGTLPAIGGIRPVTAFRCQLRDPVLDRAIECRYSMRPLPLVS